jgi:hypothetical protein
MTATPAADDPLTAFDAAARQAFSAVAGTLIPAAHGMPSAGEVINDTRLRFVLNARPDLVEPLAAALRPGLGDGPQARLAALEAEPDNLAALQLVVVGGYYTDKGVRELIGYPGQEAIEVKSWLYPEYLEEGLIDKVLAHGPVWRDPATGVRARATGIPQTYAQREWSEEHPAPTAEGGNHGHDGS